jgi:hypothetical protein
MLNFLGCGQTANGRAGGAFSRWCGVEQAFLPDFRPNLAGWKACPTSCPFQAVCVAFLPFQWMNVHKSAVILAYSEQIVKTCF